MSPEGIGWDPPIGHLPSWLAVAHQLTQFSRIRFPIASTIHLPWVWRGRRLRVGGGRDTGCEERGERGGGEEGNECDRASVVATRMRPIKQIAVIRIPPCVLVLAVLRVILNFLSHRTCTTIHQPKPPCCACRLAWVNFQRGGDGSVCWTRPQTLHGVPLSEGGMALYNGPGRRPCMGCLS